MRAALRSVWEGGEHPGLAYDVLAPTEGGKVQDEYRGTWLESIARTKLPRGYEHAYNLWVDALARGPSRSAEIETASRLLIGHGNASAIDVGLTLQTTWGVPVIPGSALKGLLNHYVDTVLGPLKDDRRWHPMDKQAPEHLRDRLAWQGVTWKDCRIERGPGEFHRALFGAPPSERDKDFPDHPNVGERQGLVTFHDAWMIPPTSDKPYLAVDVLTVHQKGYYNAQGRNGDPNDYDEPTPVSFLSASPGLRFLIALSGDPAWTDLAMKLLHEALGAWGIGGKTAAGYGRVKDDIWRTVHGPDRNEGILVASAARRERSRKELAERAAAEARQREADAAAAQARAEAERARAEAEAETERRRAAASDAFVVEFDAFLKAEGMSAKEKLAAIERDWLGRILAATPEQRAVITQRVRKKFDPPKFAEARDALLAKINPV